MQNDLGNAVVVDSDEVWLGAVVRSLEAYGFLSIATARSFRDAENVLSGEETVVVTEVVVAHESCVSLVARVRRARSSSLVVAMSDRASRAQVFRLRDHGVHAYLEKPFTAPALHQCLESLARAQLSCIGRAPMPAATEPLGRSHMQPLVDELVSRYREMRNLTNAETDVLRALLFGERRADIARERCVSVNTVKTQTRSILGKCQATTVRELTRDFMHQLRSTAMSNHAVAPPGVTASVR